MRYRFLVRSTMSSNLNSLGATLFEDFIRPCLKNKIADKTANTIIKSIVVVIGGICMLTVYVVDKLGGILEVRMF
jgi:Na+/proline symporter